MPATAVMAVTWSPNPDRMSGGGSPSGTIFEAMPLRAQNAPTS
jgi:hypothetical protein